MITSRFEVNTDTAFLDPDWEDFAELHERRYGLAIAYLKGLVSGTSHSDEHSNDVMDFVVGDNGFYVQSKAFPAAFYGDMGRYSLETVSEADAQAIVWEAVALYRANEAQSLTCVYSDATPAEVFFGYRVDLNERIERYELGYVRSGLPLHLRVMIDSDDTPDILGQDSGVLVYQRTPNGKHLVLRAPGRRQPFPLIDGIQD